MHEQGSARLLTWQSRWRNANLLAALTLSLAFGSLVFAILHAFFHIAWTWWFACLLLSATAVLWIRRPWQLSAKDVSRFLNEQCPQLEESSGLLLKNSNELGFLQQIQQEKVSQTLLTLPQPQAIFSQLKFAGYTGMVVLAVCLLLLNFPVSTTRLIQNKIASGQDAKTLSTKPTEPPRVVDQLIRISPPSYTRLPSRQQQTYALSIPEQSMVSWELKTDIAAKSLFIIFNNKDTLELETQKAENVWLAYQKIRHTGYYQVQVNDQLSDLYPISVVQDQPAAITIRQPEQHTYIDYGQPEKTDLQLTVTDDYGVKEAYVTATLASGKGEGVRFKEQKLSFAENFKAVKKHYPLHHTFDLKAMGMMPGDEMYFYVTAMDNQPQESRSEVYFVTLADTAELLSIDGLIGGVNLVPEYFRSQRQIIIDTEKLIQQRDSISESAFQTSSNNIGIDQKLLRLRYGKFLGEESETNIGGPEEHEEAAEHEHHDDAQEHKETSPAFGDPASAMESYAHNHDTAEDATFFEPELKAQLKATLTEMWSAELKLRTFYPEEALPYAYKALRLLKDLQQKSRTYVAKTAVRTPPLKPEKRLSGELDGIVEAVGVHEAAQKNENSQTLRKAVAALEWLRQGETFTPGMRLTLENTRAIVSNKAADEPIAFLSALRAINTLLKTDKQPSANINQNIATAEKALQKMIQQDEALPTANEEITAEKLSRYYFDQLNMLTNP